MHESTGAYALNALDAAELDEYEAHLATCATCQSEVADFCEVAAELSLLSLATPPPSLRDNILAAVADRPQLLVVPVTPVARPAGSSTAERRTPRRALPGSEVPDEPEPPAVDELALRRQRRRNRVLSGLVAAMLAMAVGLGGVVYTLVQERQTQIAAQTLQDELLRAPDSSVVVVQPDNGGRASFLVSRAQNRALFLGTDMPDPGQGQRYQMWTVTGNLETGDIVPALDNPVESRGAKRQQLFRGDVANADALAISIEADGSTPTKPATIVAVAPLPT